MSGHQFLQPAIQLITFYVSGYSLAYVEEPAVDVCVLWGQILIHVCNFRHKILRIVPKFYHLKRGSLHKRCKNAKKKDNAASFFLLIQINKINRN